MDEVAAQVRGWREAGARSVFARVIELQGFSTWSGDELVAVSEHGQHSGDILGRYGAEQVGAAARRLLGDPAGRLEHLTIDVHGSRIAEAGLSCGGQAELLLQPSDSVPSELWAAIAGRLPVALLTRLEGPQAGPSSVVVRPDGTWTGALGSPAGASTAPASVEAAPAGELIDAAMEAFAGGRTASRRLEDAEGTVLLEVWVPAPRVVVVGSGELVGALERQGALLGWETAATEDLAALDGLLGWAGGSAALVVLSHDPHLDAPALTAGLEAGTPYVGAMGSRRTQSRRLERLRSSGVPESLVARIHRPIGLDLGGRSAPEVALSICAQILATRRGREGRPLSERQGPINERPGLHPAPA